MGGVAVPVLPSTVAAIIRRALAKGWQLAQTGSAFHLEVSESPSNPATLDPQATSRCLRPSAEAAMTGLA